MYGHQLICMGVIFVIDYSDNIHVHVYTPCRYNTQ